MNHSIESVQAALDGLASTFANGPPPTLEDEVLVFLRLGEGIRRGTRKPPVIRSWVSGLEPAHVATIVKHACAWLADEADAEEAREAMLSLRTAAVWHALEQWFALGRPMDKTLPGVDLWYAPIDEATRAICQRGGWEDL